MVIRNTDPDSSTSEPGSVLVETQDRLMKDVHNFRVVKALIETDKLMDQIDVVIEQHGGCPIR